MSLIKDLKETEGKVVNTQKLVQEYSSIVKKMSSQIVDKYSGELDTYINKIRTILEQLRNKELKSYTDEYLELQIISIPTVLYTIVDGLENLGCEMDLSKIHRDEKYGEVFNSLTQGTIPDKENRAKQQVIAETLTNEIYKRAYNKLKKKFDVALELHSSLKKALDNRIKNKEVFRRDNVSFNAGDVFDEHERGL